MSGLGVPVLGPGSGARTVWAVQGQLGRGSSSPSDFREASPALQWVMSLAGASASAGFFCKPDGCFRALRIQSSWFRCRLGRQSNGFTHAPSRCQPPVPQCSLLWEPCDAMRGDVTTYYFYFLLIATSIPATTFAAACSHPLLAPCLPPPRAPCCRASQCPPPAKQGAVSAALSGGTPQTPSCCSPQKARVAAKIATA